MALILTALTELYERLLVDPGSGVARPGHCEGNAAVALELSREGQLIRGVPLGTQRGSKMMPMRLLLPDRPKRSSGGLANFLCDPAEYVLGTPVAGAERAKKRHKLCRVLHEQVLAGIDDDGAKAVLGFLSEWNPEAYPGDHGLQDARDALDRGGNLVFRLEGDDRFVHDRPAVIRAWDSYRASTASSDEMGQCLVTGELGPIARLHKSISGIAGAQPTGASLVSFNFPAVESYGRTQGANSPVGERAAFAYGTALNWLTSSARHRTLGGDTTIVFWADRSGPEENLLLDLFAETAGPHAQEGSQVPGDRAVDEPGAARIKSILERVVRGKHVAEDVVAFDHDVRFYILGLAPNVARVSVRFWHVSEFGKLLENLRKHFEDMAVDHRDGQPAVSIGRLLLDLAPSVDRTRDKIPRTLIGGLWRSILEGTAYPQSLYAGLITRIRADSDDPRQPKLERKVTYPRAAFIKAHLKRRARISGDTTLEEALTEMLNTENKNPGYLLGRLFALMEKAQKDANPGINATIKDRYYASASATPAAVFPVLLRLAQHHISKAEYGGYIDKVIESVLADVDRFPAHLSLDQQGLFALGYYQQRSAIYKKAE
ncbi:MAG: type I-C CRISPR-associated protein Cas8c/Csd1 [Bacillota bacterium]|nr:type I-C CRISPR-associated protein Cas8c/Csd1 [Bacillota bacterium]